MKTLFLATYFNNPHFIELQAKTLRRFVEDDFDFVVLDDSEETTRSILSNNLSREEIRNECVKHGVGHVQVPQSIHAYYRQGGYVPDENPTVHHPTERHQALIRWLFKNYKSLGFDSYKNLVLFDADVFFKKPINMSQYMDHDIMGTYREQDIKLPLGRFPDNMFPPKVKALDGQTINFFNLCILFVNLERVSNIETMDIGSWPGTDTGSKTNFFIKENPQYKYAFLLTYPETENRVEVLTKGYITDCEAAEILHYRSGSNWSYENADYYREKLNRMLKKHIPEFANNETVNHDVISRDGEHTLRK